MRRPNRTDYMSFLDTSLVLWSALDDSIWWRIRLGALCNPCRSAKKLLVNSRAKDFFDRIVSRLWWSFVIVISRMLKWKNDCLGLNADHILVSFYDRCAQNIRKCETRFMQKFDRQRTILRIPGEEYISNCRCPFRSKYSIALKSFLLMSDASKFRPKEIWATIPR